MSAIAAGRDISPLTVRDSREIALVDLLDRLLAGGVVLAGDVTISLAGVDLVRVSLRAIITSIHEATVDVDSWEQVDDG
ncbi:gas vesicle protein [Saccharopolyspora oryzae]|uniref:Gas vesicle protein n=1 Tax=Saccharopolyspora oryzae TaxID=2997343 RepID=A0ABT4UPZ4_9PSEU|nr:gas vesicle protein [Saccharopolyspora oryzae]MDA3623803.1 gas vesicle protein [Saccharopolyspora oryzae]